MAQTTTFASIPILLFSFALSGCKATDTEAPPAPDSTQAQPSKIETAEDTKEGKLEMSALANLLSTYASASNNGWDVFDAVPGVTWTEQGKVENPDAKPENAYSRSGKLLLTGFKETDIPNGKAGPDADYVRGNEGASGVTLNGTEERVTSIAVNKFYPDSNYLKVLEAQLGAGDFIQPITSSCLLAEGTTTGEANYARNQFFKLSLASGSTLFAEGTADEEGGKYSPGSTTYFFYKEEPSERISSMNCTRT